MGNDSSDFARIVEAKLDPFDPVDDKINRRKRARYFATRPPAGPPVPDPAFIATKAEVDYVLDLTSAVPKSAKGFSDAFWNGYLTDPKHTAESITKQAIYLRGIFTCAHVHKGKGLFRIEQSEAWKKLFASPLAKLDT